MLTIETTTGDISLAGSADSLLFSRGDVLPLPVAFTRDGAPIAPPEGMTLTARVALKDQRGGQGELVTASGFTTENAGVGAAIVTLDLSGAGVAAVFVGGQTPSVEAELQVKWIAGGFTRHTEFVPCIILNTLFA